jgi:hypothetical protein
LCLNRHRHFGAKNNKVTSVFLVERPLLIALLAYRDAFVHLALLYSKDLPALACLQPERPVCISQQHGTENLLSFLPVSQIKTAIIHWLLISCCSSGSLFYHIDNYGAE